MTVFQISIIALCFLLLAFMLFKFIKIEIEFSDSDRPASKK